MERFNCLQNLKYFRVMEIFDVPKINFGKIAQSLTVVLFFGIFGYAFCTRRFKQKPDYKKFTLLENAEIIEKDFKKLAIMRRRILKNETKIEMKLCRFKEVIEEYEELKRKNIAKLANQDEVKLSR